MAGKFKAPVCDTKPDSYMIDYKPCRSRISHSEDPDSKTLFLLKLYNPRESLPTGLTQVQIDAFYARIKSWIEKTVKSCASDAYGVVLSIAPGHSVTSKPSGFMHEVVDQYLTEHRRIVVDGRQQLIRTKTVEKQSKSSGPRTEDTHRGTIAIDSSLRAKDLNKDKVVIILDDVWTSGSTLRVCKEVMRTTNPKKVKLLAIGKTVPEEKAKKRKQPPPEWAAPKEKKSKSVTH